MRPIFFTCLLGLIAVYADPIIPETLFQKKIDLEPQEDELVAVERMIDLVKRQQIALDQIKKLIIELRGSREFFLKGDLSKLHATYMVNAASEILHLVQEHHLEHLFSSDFMEDLAVYAQIGRQQK